MIRIGIIGFGGMANYHLSHMRRSGLFHVAGAYDINPQALRHAEKRGVPAFDSYEQLVQQNLDACLISTPNDVHEEYALKLAKDHIHILCEKPVTLSSQSLNRMLRAAEKNHVICMVHQNRRWDKDYLIIKKLYENNSVGCVYKVDSNVTGSHGLPGTWRKIKSKGGGMLWDWGVHLIDQIINMNPTNVVGVTCRGSYVYGCDCDDGIYMTLDFEDGFVANIYIDTNKFIATPRWYAYGVDGTAYIKNWTGQGKIVKVKSFMDVKNKGIRAGNGFTKTMADRSKSTIMIKPLPRIKRKKYEFYQNFHDCVTQKAQPIITGESIVRCMQVIEAGFQSMEEKRTISVSI